MPVSHLFEQVVLVLLFVELSLLDQLFVLFAGETGPLQQRVAQRQRRRLGPAQRPALDRPTQPRLGRLRVHTEKVSS